MVEENVTAENCQTLLREELKEESEKSRKLEMLLQRLLNKVNMVTCYWRHQK